MIVTYEGIDPTGQRARGEHHLTDYQPLQGQDDVAALAQQVSEATGWTAVRVLHLTTWSVLDTPDPSQESSRD